MFSGNVTLKSQSGIGKDPQAKKILDKLKKGYENNKSTEVTFDLVLELPGQKTEKQQGKLIQSGKKFVALMSDQEVYSDGKYVWLYLKSQKEVQINNYDPEMKEDFVSPEQLLRMYENGKYEYSITGEETIGNEKLTLIEFKPVEKNNQYSKIRLAVVKNGDKPNYIKVFSKDGSKYTLVIKSMVHNKTYASDAFVFNAKKYPGVHVEDLRID